MAALRVAARALCAALALSSALPSSADEVHLQDGSLLEGVILEETPALLRLAVQRGGDRVVVEVPRGQVRWVRRLTAQDEVLLRDAEAALLAGDHALAIKLLEALIGARPDDPRARREHGFALLLANREAEAALAFERAAVLDPVDAEALLGLAATYERLARRDDAIDAWRRVTRVGPRHVRAWRALARGLLTRAGPRDRAEALDALARAAAEDPRDEAVALERVDALCPDWSRLGGASDSPPGSSAERGRAEAQAVLEAYVRCVPEAVEPARRLARLLASAGEWKTAAETAGRLAVRPGLRPATRERIAADAALYAWHAEGARAAAPAGADAGDVGIDPAQAEARLVLLLEETPDDGRLLVAWARVALRSSRFADAAARLERAVLAPNAPLADVLLLQEVVDSIAKPVAAGGERPPLLGADVAVPKARRAVALAPWIVAAHEALAQALARDGAHEAAAEAWEAGALRAEGEERARLERAAVDARESAARSRRNTGT